jgi:hypothetical protein
MTIRKALPWSLAAMALALAAPASAAEKVAEKACKADAQKFCKDIPPGEGRVAACMKSHEAELSQGCKDQIAAMKEKMKEFAQACKPDAEKLCKGIPHGKGRILSCLASHEADLSPACRAEMQK